MNKIHLSSFGLTQKFKSRNTDATPVRPSIHQSQPGQPCAHPGRSLVPSSAYSAAAAWSRRLEVKQLLQHPELENSNPESRVSHTDPKFQGAIRSHKKEQNTSKFRNNRSPGTNVTAVRAYNLGPNSCTSEHFPNKSYFPKQKHLTVKTHIEVINHRPQQKRSVNEDRVQTEEKREKTKGSLVSASPGCQPISIS